MAIPSTVWTEIRRLVDRKWFSQFCLMMEGYPVSKEFDAVFEKDDNMKQAANLFLRGDVELNKRIREGLETLEEEQA